MYELFWKELKAWIQKNMIPHRNQEFMGKTGQNVRTIQIIQIMTSHLQKVCILKKI